MDVDNPIHEQHRRPVLARLSWAQARTAFVLIGAAFVAISLLGACLDYAGEEALQVCDAGAADAGTPEPPEGSGSSLPTLPDPADCGAPAPSTGTGSGS